MPLLLDIPMLKTFQLQGGFAPLTRGSAPGPRCMGALPPDTRYRLALSAHHGPCPPIVVSCPPVSEFWLRACSYIIPLSNSA